jgi:hypothetical protein
MGVAVKASLKSMRGNSRLAANSGRADCACGRGQFRSAGEADESAALRGRAFLLLVKAAIIRRFGALASGRPIRYGLRPVFA